MRNLLINRSVFVPFLIIAPIIGLVSLVRLLFEFDAYYIPLFSGSWTIAILLFLRKFFTDKELFLWSGEKFNFSYWILPILFFLSLCFFMQQTFGFEWIGFKQVTVNAFIAINEEGILRSICFGLLLLKLQDKPYYVLKATLISASVFSVLHLFNLLYEPFSIDFLIETILQLGYSFLFGIGFAGITYKTKTIWIAVFLHMLVDLFTDTNRFFPDDTRFADNVYLSIVFPAFCFLIFLIGLFFAIGARANSNISHPESSVMV
jgi:membrane protease YdiL (CAAX protease family)